jgi:hypothetical protein
MSAPDRLELPPVGAQVYRFAGVARFIVSMDRRPAEPMMIRLTHAYRREDGTWKVVHEHSDFQLADRVAEPPL